MYRDTAFIYKRRLFPQVMVGQELWFGDSITDGWNLTRYAPLAINMGVGGITSTDLLNLLDGQATHILKAGAANVMIGINDIASGQYDALMANIPLIAQALAPVQVTWMAVLRPYKVLPVTDVIGKLTRVNAAIYQQRLAMPNCLYVPPLDLQPEHYQIDGVHPNHAGYRLLAWHKFYGGI